MSAASVVDLPEPVGPVTTTRPLARLHRESKSFGRPSCSTERILDGMTRNTAPMPFRSTNRFERKRAMPEISCAKSVSCVPSNSSRLRLGTMGHSTRSEEHTSELQSQSNLVCRLLLEKKNNTSL